MSVASLPPTPTVSPALPLHRNLRVAIVTCATIALLIVLTRYWPIVQGALHEISLHPTVLLAGPLLALCFIACKGASLTAACHAAHMPMTPRAGVRTFIEGTVIESISWPGKLMGDIYRASVLPATSIIQRASALVLWRIGTLLATLILVITAAALTHNQLHTQSAWHHAALLAAVITAACIATWFIASRTHHLRAANLTGRRAFTAISRITAYSLLATLADLTAIAFFAATIANVNALTFLPLFIFASLIASASTIPMAAGILDAGCYFALTHSCGTTPEAATAIILCYRALGPGITLAAGAASFLLVPARTSLQSLQPAPPPTSQSQIPHHETHAPAT